MTRALPSKPSVQSQFGVSEGATRVGSLPARAIGWAGLVLAVIALMLPGTAAARTRAARPADAGLGARTVARLDRTLRSTWAGTWAPGVLAGVWGGDHGWTAALGSAQRAAGPRPLLSDHTRIGSVTKTMIGTLVLELVDRHKLQLDESIARWFPQLPDAGQITIRDLGDMSSGIASYTTNPTFTSQYFSDPTMSWSPDQLIADGAALPRTFTPGDGFDYSDTNFVMLGRILERVTHEPLAQL